MCVLWLQQQKQELNILDVMGAECYVFVSIFQADFRIIGPFCSFDVIEMVHLCILKCFVCAFRVEKSILPRSVVIYSSTTLFRLEVAPVHDSRFVWR